MLQTISFALGVIVSLVNLYQAFIHFKKRDVALTIAFTVAAVLCSSLVLVSFILPELAAFGAILVMAAVWLTNRQKHNEAKIREYRDEFVAKAIITLVLVILSIGYLWLDSSGILPW